MCLQYMILVHETYELWLNKFCMIYITKSWNVKFVMQYCKKWKDNISNQPIGNME
jgi:hypothetical protein